MEPTRKVTIILLGYVGSGKSSTGNSILSESRFLVKAGTVRTTQTIQAEYEYVNGVYVQVIDTPGLEKASEFPSLLEDIDGKKTDGHFVTTAIVISVGRYTPKERTLIEELFRNYKNHIPNPFIIFTKRKELDTEDNPADRFVDSWVAKNPSLQSIIRKNNLMYMSFENKRKSEEENKTQVNDLLEAILDLEKQNNHCPVSVIPKHSICQTEKISVSRRELEEHWGKTGAEFFDDRYQREHRMKFEDNFNCRNAVSCKDIGIPENSRSR